MIETTIWILWMLSLPHPTAIKGFESSDSCQRAITRVLEQAHDIQLWCEPLKFEKGRPT